MKEKLNSAILKGIPLLMIAAIMGTALGITRIGNNFFNNKIRKKPTYYSVSYATGITGHMNYVSYSDGSQEFKEYPGLGHRWFDSDLCQDFNGDGKVDRIRRNGAEWKYNSLTEILVREYDYDSHKKRFDDADRKLKELNSKYSPKG
ncbi:hypothetical protein M0R19_01660 [Candidatus Pacearchaeota archaeon]|jgi:hypothetical protein|nr:hypothetical protein [Candidatus Pacearchaeota archaeon]